MAGLACACRLCLLTVIPSRRLPNVKSLSENEEARKRISIRMQGGSDNRSSSLDSSVP